LRFVFIGKSDMYLCFGSLKLYVVLLLLKEFLFEGVD